MKVLVCLAVFFVLAAPALAGSFVYISVGEENLIAMYKMDTKSGKLEYAESVKMDGSPGALAVDPKKQFLFMALRTTKKIGSYSIGKEGTLRQIGTISTGMNPVYLATDHTGKYLLSSSYSEGKVMSHAINADGSIQEKPITNIDTDKMAHSILPDPSNRFAFVPHTGPNLIEQFLFDTKTGKLSYNKEAKIKGEPDAEPRHLWFHPKKNFVYFDNEKGSSVTAYKLDTETGQLTAFQTISTLPKDFTGKNTCAHIEMTPNGLFLYASNRGHDSIAGYAVDAETGKLTSLGQFATEKTPRAFTIDPSGKYLYAAGQASGKLAAYTIDPKKGTLERFATYNVGKGPAWVTVVERAD